MDLAWRTLHRAGLPLAGERSGPAPSADEMARCVREIVRDGSGSAREREALAAFVLAWADQWPHTFARVFAGDGASLVAWAERIAADDDRRIKLRRIAIESLASVL